ncbi:NAD-dependent epimerase/dehydratase family protein [Sinorhizobium fredii]|uniref:NAD-dependent epimerase/dehydratase family protein n=1 Tax=Rhizobium fredii TaxID=380 RepID=A0A844A811_RHIFR|nr:NAD(P)-dependent oxidoreductase [Sinorhizobium fredii]MQW97342.1 NAD-dependent epimerase/dehydratase family protein [Sinorhizobium fredii]MQX07985.1 NAD-dependent epimerase/dehydratase family protein [Sinorhizobium fredii]UTY51397.1 NAD(P)-dependent oxidoreductase [Sinorhizobium fredii]GEC35301.1 NAD-dependent epimerase [Sinorhizobium fredii]GLS11191.1 NAD-dependent epimerase [Sinorhizobium fredii]
MTILVTGSAGHLGEALMRVLRGAGRPVRGIDIKTSDFTDHVGSVADTAFVRHAVSGVRAVIHAATLHKPHVATHGYSEFVETNIAGTLNLLEAAADASVDAFVFTSTTSAFGSALTPAPGSPAAWITEDVTPIPRNIYGVSKVAAEGLCELFARRHRLPVVVLRTSRFFPEADDDAEIRGRYETENTQANELLYRRADIEDVVSAHLAALEKAKELGFGRYIISAPTPFTPDDLAALRTDAARVVLRHFPDCEALYAERGWKLFPSIDRVYVSASAMASLGWRPKYDFAHVLRCLRRGEDFRSPLTREIGSKGYHDTVFAEGPYPVA